MNKILLAALSLFLVTQNAKAQCTASGVLLDDLKTTTSSITGTHTAGVTLKTTSTGSGIIGGQRDIRVTSTATGTSSEIVGPWFAAPFQGTFAFGPSGSIVLDGPEGIVITYDGNDDADAATLDATVGLGGINMAGTGTFNFNLQAADPIGAGLFASYKMRVYSSPTQYSEATYTINGPSAAITTTTNISFASGSFSTGPGALGPADFTSVRAVEIRIATDQGGYDFVLRDGIYVPCPNPKISNVTCQNNGTLHSAADDYLTFNMTPTAPTAFYEDPYTYTITASQGGSPVTVLLSDGTAATAVNYGFAQSFRLANGTAGGGNVIITTTPNWGSYTAKVDTLFDPGACAIVACAGGAGPKTVTYTYQSPLGGTEYTNAQAFIPKFNTAGGKTLTQVEVTYAALAQSSYFAENSSVGVSNFRARASTDVFFEYPNPATTLATSTVFSFQTPGYPALTSITAGVSVPASGTWLGDYTVASTTTTLNRMRFAPTPGPWLSEALFANQNPLLDPRWVTNATGVATDDDDIFVGLGSGTYPATSSTFTSAGDLANFTGASGNIPFTYSTISGIATTGGGGGLTAGQVSKTSFNVTVTYTYTETCNKSLGNRVWRDDNKDGLQSAGEPGVAGVSVALYKGTNLIASTTTDAYGMYLFTDLPAATDYSIKVTPPANYSFTTAGTPGASGAGTATDCDVNASGISPAITHTALADQLDVDAGLIFTATSVSSIGDRVWLDANSNGTQDVGEDGVAGVTVILYKETTSGSGVYVSYMTTATDANGLYLFNNLPNNTNYKVGVTPLPNTLLTSSTGTTSGAATTNSDLDASTGLSAAINIPLAGAAYTGIDAGLIADPKSSLGDRVWNDLNNNGIQDAGEPGVPNVVMTLLKETTPGSGVYASAGTATTDVNGIYIFSNLDPANYKVSGALPAGYSVATVDAGSDDYLDNDFSATATPTTGVYGLLANQDYMGIDFGIRNSTAGLGSIGDRVWSDVNGNGIQDGAEPGLPGITVRLLDGSGNPVNNPATGQPYVVITDANGNYKFVDLTAATYRVNFGNLPINTQFSPTGAGTTATDSDPNPATGTTSNIVLTAGANITTIDAGVVPFSSVGLGSIGDRVWVDANNDGIQDAGEQGIAGVTVTLYAADGTTVITSTTTNPSGGYLFDGLSAGSYVVGFSGFPSGYALQTGKNDVGSNDLVDSDPNPATGKTAVINLGTGEDNASVDAGIFHTTATNSIGDYVWADVNGDGLQTSGEPAFPGILVSLLNSSGDVVSSVLTDANGAYSFKNLPNGNYTVQIALPTGLSFTTPNAGTIADVNINSKVNASGITSAIALTGGTNVTNIDAGIITTKAVLGDRVWNDVDGNGIQNAGEPGIAGVTVTLYASDGTTVLSSMITDANGNYLFTNLDPGSFVLGFTTTPSGLVFTTKDATGFTAANGSDVNVGTGKTDVITLASGAINLNVDAGLAPVILGAISGVVWFDGTAGDDNRAAGEPLVPGVTVTLRNSGGTVLGTTRTDGNGAYLFNDVPPGTGYIVTFSNYPGSLVNQTTGTATGSDPDATTGVTPTITVVGGVTTINIDAGVTVYVPLPLSLIYFNAQSSNCDVVLNWKFASESSIKEYLIERSTNGVDFSEIAMLKTKGNNSTYQYTDSKAFDGERMYRLKVVNTDGTHNYSSLVKVNTSCQVQPNIYVYPNPTNTNLNIDLTEINTNVEFQMVDALGRVLLSGTLQHSSVNKLDVHTLSNGVYSLKVITDENVQTQQIQIVK